MPADLAAERAREILNQWRPGCADSIEVDLADAGVTFIDTDRLASLSSSPTDGGGKQELEQAVFAGIALYCHGCRRHVQPSDDEAKEIAKVLAAEVAALRSLPAPVDDSLREALRPVAVRCDDGSIYVLPEGEEPNDDDVVLYELTAAAPECQEGVEPSFDSFVLLGSEWWHVEKVWTGEEGGVELEDDQRGAWLRRVPTPDASPEEAPR